MKEKLKIIIVIIVVIVSLFLVKKIYDKAITNNYDYIIVGNNCNCQKFRKCKHTIVIKDNESKEIKKELKKDKKNLYKIVKIDDTITYLDYETWYSMYESIGYRDCFDCSEYKNEIDELLSSYEYNKKDKESFEKIINLIENDKIEDIEYFIITDKNYYIFNGLEEVIYKYNEQNKSLDNFLKLGTCDIDYFYEK